jgi:hypothetical protein
MFIPVYINGYQPSEIVARQSQYQKYEQEANIVCLLFRI